MTALTLILAASSAAESSTADASLLAPAIVAAIVAGAVSLATFILAGRRARVDRQRQLFADAFATVMEYREYPFIIRRRNREERASEQQRISTALSEIQVKLKAFQGSLRVEAPEVGERYADLVRATRRIAGAAIREAWEAEPVAEDAEVNAPPFDFTELVVYDDAYLEAVARHLAWWPRRSQKRAQTPEP